MLLIWFFFFRYSSFYRAILGKTMAIKHRKRVLPPTRGLHCSFVTLTIQDSLNLRWMWLQIRDDSNGRKQLWNFSWIYVRHPQLFSHVSLNSGSLTLMSVEFSTLEEWDRYGKSTILNLAYHRWCQFAHVMIIIVSLLLANFLPSTCAASCLHSCHS